MADRGLSKNTALNAIYRLKGHGELISPARGLYVIVPPEHQPHGSIPPQELVPLVMQYLGTNYYVALLSAGLFHGATHINRYAPIALLMDEFFQKLQKENKSTPYPARQVEKLLRTISSETT